MRGAATAPAASARLAPGSHLACHDSNDVNQRPIRDCFPIVDSCTLDSLFIGLIGPA